MNFNEQKTIASEKWEKLQTKKGIVIYVGAASCGRAAGCDAVTEAIRKYLKENNLKADILEVGCIGLCCFEPLVYIQKDRKPPICYVNLNPKIIPKLLEDILKKNNLRGDLALGIIGEKAYSSIPSIYDHPMLKPQVRIVLRNCGIINPTDIDQIDNTNQLVRFNGLNTECESFLAIKGAVSTSNVFLKSVQTGWQRCSKILSQKVVVPIW